jgi:Fic family protein
MFLRREAEYSSRIEQTHARLQTMLLFEELPKLEEDAPDVREVANNFRVLEFAFEATARWPITVAMIRRMHEILWKGVERRHLTPGRFRTVQNFIGRTRNIQDARYVPPPPQEVEPCMRELVGFMQKPGNLPALVRCALVHYQFEAIHPFVDGNGRIGRALMLLMLKNEDLLPVPLLNPSAQLERNRREYYDLLLDVSRVGAWEAWLEFFAVCVADEAKDACERLTKLENLRDGYRRKFSAARTSALLMRLIDDLFADPAISAPRTAKALRVSAPNAQRLIDKLVKARVLREVTGKRRNRVYIAQEIVDLFSSRS